MVVRILTAWAGSPPCGTVLELPDALALSRISVGYAEPAASQSAPIREIEAPETTMEAPGETAMLPPGKPRKRGR